MSLNRAYVGRMTTSREGPTKYEHFAILVNDAGEEMSLFMRHNPEEALFMAHEIAQFAGIPVTPLLIDGEEVKLSEMSLMMLDKD